jgi:hypothetical protein
MLVMGTPTLPYMFRMRVGDSTEGRTRLARWLLGIACAAFAIWGSFQFFTQVVGTHITDCDFDANGAYAEVRVNNLLGWVPHRQEVWVDFYLDGREFAEQDAYPRVPAFGRGRTVVRAADFPRADDHASGRTVYVDATHHHHVRFVTKKFAEANPRTTLTEVVPDASHALSCGLDYTDPD